VLILIVLGVVVAGLGPMIGYSRLRAEGAPGTMLWAWERPEDLSFIDTGRVGVAYLARTLTLTGDRLIVRPRAQPLTIPHGAYVVAVVRVETGRAPTLTPARIGETADAIAAADRDRVRAIQIDFDATVSERAFYRDLIGAVRARLPRDHALTITALVSWCLQDRWFDDLPIDDAVPMLFRMGADRRSIAARLAGGGDFDAPLCRHSAGLSTDEADIGAPARRRLYLFNPQPWSASALGAALARIRR